MRGERLAEVGSGDTPAIRLEAFESFYARQQRRLVGLAFSVSGSRLGAEELAQDALMAAYRDWDRIQRLDDPEVWVRRMLLNRAVSRYRRRASELKALARLAGRREVQAFVEVSDNADHVWVEVRRLPKRQVQVVALRYVEDLTLDDIGLVLGCSKETVNTHLRRARATLARRLRLEEDL